MPSESSFLTTAASDTSSSADSRYYSGGARRPNLDATSTPLSAHPSPRRKLHTLNARGAAIAKSGTANQKVLCACRSCKGQRLVSKSTCYRHLRVEREIEEDDAKWDHARWRAHNTLPPSSHGLGDHIPSNQ